MEDLVQAVLKRIGNGTFDSRTCTPEEIERLIYLIKIGSVEIAPNYESCVARLSLLTPAGKNRVMASMPICF